MSLEFINVALDKGAYIPDRAHDEDAGLDLRTPVAFTIAPRGKATIDTGVHVEIPRGYGGFLKSKSGLNVNKDITTDGTIDAGYTGSITVKLYNNGDSEVSFPEGAKITQLVIQKVETPKVRIVNEVKGFERGDNGFGSTGV